MPFLLSNISLVSLGAGTLACYGKAEQGFTFYDIDPLVERIARNSNLFTYLKDRSPQPSVNIGDSRVTLARAPKGFYGMFILDAFSGDSIPVHLLTLEAVDLYLSKLVPDGMLLFHVSNRYMDLTGVLDRVAAKLNLMALVQHDIELSDAEIAEGKQPSSWVMMAREKDVLSAFQSDARWKPLINSHQGEVWTDDYSNILQVLRLTRSP